MIIEFIWNELIIGIINFLIDVIPVIDVSLQMPDLSFFSMVIGVTDYFFPLETVVACVVILLNFQHGKFVLKIAIWIIKRIPFLN